MSWLVDVINAVLLALGDAAQWVWHDAFGAIGAGLVWVSGVADPVLAPVVTLINYVSNGLGRSLLALIGVTPGWVSNTLISAVTGVLLLVIFKYTSNQAAIGRVRDRIKAEMLAAKLYRDEVRVTLRAQRRLLTGALALLGHSIRPMLIMLVPVVLLLAQMGLWYQWRPLGVGDETLLTVTVNRDDSGAMPKVRIDSMPGAEVVVGPVRVAGKNQVCWKIRATEPGKHTIVFGVGRDTFDKQLVVGEGIHRVSPIRPGHKWTAILLYPAEAPLASDSPIASIGIDYPTDSHSIAAGADWWVVYFFVVSMIVALLFKPLMKVRI